MLMFERSVLASCIISIRRNLRKSLFLFQTMKSLVVSLQVEDIWRVFELGPR